MLAIRSFIGYLLAVAIVYPSGALGAEYVFERSLKFNTEYRDTAIGDVDASELMEFNLFPEISLQRGTEHSELTADINTHFRRYDQDNFDSDEYEALLSYKLEFDRSDYFLSARAERSSTFIDSVEGRDSTQTFFGAEDTDTHAFNARSTFRLTEKKSLTFSAGVTNREYKESRRFDSFSTSASVRFNNQLSQRFSAVFLINGNDFRSDDEKNAVNFRGIQSAIRDAFPDLTEENYATIDEQLIPFVVFECEQEGSDDAEVNFDDYGGSNGVSESCFVLSRENNSQVAGAQLGFNFRATETLSINALAGASRVRVDASQKFGSGAQDVSERTNNTETWDLGINYSLQRSSYGLALNRKTDAGSEGNIKLRHDVNASYSHQFSEVLSGGIILQWLEEESALEIFSFEDRERWSVSGSLSRAWSPNLTTTIRYRYYDESRRFRLDSTQHAALFTIKWHADPIVWSR